ncbi:uncharacterized protein LOC128668278 isoform X1 [Microplitis demolitor]|uniref:uncharacterized protein LOC128668278 isoform X1 n=1 Tax=Microplitis demolitor TaxID=69319 RepID=UPI00235B677B|nr:uncharacterized protein LOC128668278 isoform X1 [Microplitis demolitor]XP_053596980.1 uncharacterized protein LOC128668278 isoform X1 [Microplitis demolitor]
MQAQYLEGHLVDHHWDCWILGKFSLENSCRLYYFIYMYMMISAKIYSRCKRKIKSEGGSAIFEWREKPSTLLEYICVKQLAEWYSSTRDKKDKTDRRKRVSDQRLAELETLLALARMRGKLVTVPVGFGRVDPAKIGRRRRSSIDHDLLKLKRILQAVVDDNFGTESVSEENDEISSSLQFGDPHEDIED